MMMMMMRGTTPTILIAVIVLFIVAIISDVHGLTIKIEPNREECFYETVEQANVKVQS